MQEQKKYKLSVHVSTESNQKRRREAKKNACNSPFTEAASLFLSGMTQSAAVELWRLSE